MALICVSLFCSTVIAVPKSIPQTELLLFNGHSAYLVSPGYEVLSFEQYVLVEDPQGDVEVVHQYPVIEVNESFQSLFIAELIQVLQLARSVTIVLRFLLLRLFTFVCVCTASARVASSQQTATRHIAILKELKAKTFVFKTGLRSI